MSAIYLDPDQMDATGGVVSELAREVEGMATEVDALATTSVPPSLAGWFAEEVREIALSARLGALLYLVATIDAMQRSEQIRANQSLAAAVTAPVGTTATFAGSIVGGGFVLGEVQPVTNPFTGPYVGGGFVLGEVQPVTNPFTGPYAGGGGFLLGQVDTSGYTPTSITIGSSQETFLAHNPLVRIAAMQGSTPASSIPDMAGYHDGNLWTLSDERRGVTYMRPGKYEHGGRVGDWNVVAPRNDEE